MSQHQLKKNTNKNLCSSNLENTEGIKSWRENMGVMVSGGGCGKVGRWREYISVLIGLYK